MTDVIQKSVFHLKEFEKAYGYAQAVKVDKMLYISGTVSIDDAGNPLAAGDMPAQVRNIYQDIGQTLAAHGASFDHVVKEAIFTLDLDRFTEKTVSVKAHWLQSWDETRHGRLEPPSSTFLIGYVCFDGRTTDISSSATKITACPHARHSHQRIWKFTTQFSC